jgi:hypothetical protein
MPRRDAQQPGKTDRKDGGGTAAGLPSAAPLEEIAHRERLPRRAEINPFTLKEDRSNCLLLRMKSPIEHSQLVIVGANLAAALAPEDTLRDVLLPRLSWVVSSRGGLIFDGGAMLGGVDIGDRSISLPLSEDGVTIDHVLAAVSYHPLPVEDALTPQVVSQTNWF